MADFLHCLAAVWCFELGGLFTWYTKTVWMDETWHDHPEGIYTWLLGSVFMALGWWLA